MELSNLLVKEKTTKVDFPGKPGFILELSYIGREKLNDMRDKCTAKKLNKKTRQMEDNLDTEAFQELYIKEAIKGWEGLKYKYLKTLVPVDLSDIENMEDCLEFSDANASLLMLNSSDLDNFVTDTLGDLENFT